MTSRNTIELKFCEETPTIRLSDTSPRPKENVKKLNFNGFVIEVLESSVKKLAAIEFKFNNRNENDDPNINKANNGEGSTSKTKPTQSESKAPLVVSCHSTTSNNDLEGAAGLWAKTDAKVACFIDSQIDNLTNPSNPTIESKSKPKTLLEIKREQDDKILAPFMCIPQQKPLSPDRKDSQPRVEPPPVTEEDFEIIRHFMEPEAPCCDSNQEDFVCSLCLVFIPLGEGVVLKGCVHNFCRPCLINSIKNSHNQMGQVQCPFTIEPCESLIEDEEVKALLGDEYEWFTLKVVQMLDDEIRKKERQEESSIYDVLPALLDADNNDYIENFEAFECTVCLVEAAVGEGVILKNCLHNFCKICIIEQVKNADEFNVKCPHADEKGSCEFSVQEREIRYLVPDDVYEKHLEKSLKQYEGALGSDAYHCKTPDCRGFVEVDENLRGFTCEVCRVINCIGCKVIHTGKNCQEYQDELNPDGKRKRENAESETAIENLIASDQALWCPRCGIPVMKDQGCDFIKCTACQLGICWRMKKPRLPFTKNNGQVVDGCHCKENGKLCHPQCKNCH